MGYFTAKKRTLKAFRKLISFRISSLDDLLFYEERPHYKILRDTRNAIDHAYSLADMKAYLQEHKGEPIGILDEIQKRKINIASLPEEEQDLPPFLSQVGKSLKNKAYQALINFLQGYVGKRAEYLFNRTINFSNRHFAHAYFPEIQIQEPSDPKKINHIKEQKTELKQLVDLSYVREFMRRSEEVGGENLEAILTFQLNTLYIEQVVHEHYNHELFLEADLMYSAAQHNTLLQMQPSKFVPVAIKRFLNRYSPFSPLRRFYNMVLHRAREFSYGDKYLQTLTSPNFPETAGDFLNEYKLLFPITYMNWDRKVVNPESMPESVQSPDLADIAQPGQAT